MQSDSVWSRRRWLGATGAMITAGSILGAQDQAQESNASAANQTWTGSPFGIGLLAFRVAVITGGARGIGRAIAVEIASMGADFVGIDVCYRVVPLEEYRATNSGDLEECGRLVREHGRNFS
jgi:hypothetical protein